MNYHNLHLKVYIEIVIKLAWFLSLVSFQGFFSVLLPLSQILVRWVLSLSPPSATVHCTQKLYMIAVSYFQGRRTLHWNCAVSLFWPLTLTWLLPWKCCPGHCSETTCINDNCFIFSVHIKLTWDLCTVKSFGPFDLCHWNYGLWLKSVCPTLWVSTHHAHGTPKLYMTSVSYFDTMTTTLKILSGLLLRNINDNYILFSGHINLTLESFWLLSFKLWSLTLKSICPNLVQASTQKLYMTTVSYFKGRSNLPVTCALSVILTFDLKIWPSPCKFCGGSCLESKWQLVHIFRA